MNFQKFFTVIDIKFPNFMEVSNKFPVFYENRPQISRFHWNGTDTEFPDFSQE